MDSPLPHLDQPFDYLVPEDVEAPVGCRVVVPFAGTRLDGFVVGAQPATHAGALRPISRVVSELTVLTPAVLELARELARALAGTTMDVLRLAVPPRHARTEKHAELEPAPVSPTEAPPATQWSEYAAGAAFLEHVAAGDNPRAVWQALPGVAGSTPRWVVDVTAAVQACLASGRRALVVVPTAAVMEAVAAQLATLGSVITYHSELAPAERYRAFLTVLAGRADIAVGTRGAAYLPVKDLGLTVLWECDDDSFAEPHAPHPSALHVVARREGAILLGSLTRPVRAQLLVADGWARLVAPPRGAVRAAAPRVIVPDQGDLHGERARVPELAFRVVRQALAAGPVLVHTPRSGYLHAVRCASCGQEARCVHCHGPLSLKPEGAVCSWCGKAAAFVCPQCGGTRVRAHTVGSERTGEEFARSFPGVPVLVSSSSAGITRLVDDTPRLVVATPGSEPLARAGYRAALILDAHLATARPELGAGPEALARWAWVASLTRPAPEGQVLVLGEPDPRVAGALVRWDPGGYAERELAERAELRFPPAWKVALLEGPDAELMELGRELAEQAGAEILGPEGERLLVRVPRHDARRLVELLRQLSRERSVKKETIVRITVDPEL